MDYTKITSQEELDKYVQGKADQSFKAGLEKGRSSSNDSSIEELEALRTALKERDEKILSSEEQLKAVQAKLRPFEEKEAYKQDLKAFQETGKAKDNVALENYNYKKFSTEEGIDWDAFLEANPHLKNETKVNSDTTLSVEDKKAEEEIRAKLESEHTTDMKFSNL